MHVGLERGEQRADRRFREDDDVIDAAEGGDELGAIGSRKDGSALPFQRADGVIVVDRDHQHVGFASCGLEIADVADVQQVEAAVGECDRAPRRALLGDASHQLVA